MPTRAKDQPGQKRIAWNGLQIFVPKTWDGRVTANDHLIFESDFQPLVQIRRQQSAALSPRALNKKIKQWATELGGVAGVEALPGDLQPLADTFGQVNLFYQANTMITGGICRCPDCRKLILFHILTSDPALIKEVHIALATLCCGKQPENLWCLQDFSLLLPPGYTLLDYTFAAGLTRLSFKASDHQLQTCTLGPADIRRQRQSLPQILTALSDTPKLQIGSGADVNYCAGLSNPAIGQQILMRLRRKMPFISAAIRHDTETNRLLAVVLSAKRPLAPTAARDILHNYEIIPTK